MNITNFLLTLIVIILLFGAGSIIGFIQAMFVLGIFIVVIVSFIFFLINDISETQAKESQYKNFKENIFLMFFYWLVSLI